MRGAGKMRVPTDFDRDLWFDPLTFQGLVGTSLSNGKYNDLFRPDGFAKPRDELTKLPWVARAILASTTAPDAMKRNG